MKLFSHNDLDGKSCGIVAMLALGEENVETFYCSHDNINRRVSDFLLDPEQEKKPVYITDIAVNDELAGKLQSRYESGREVQLIDHHVTADHLNKFEWGLVQTKQEDGKLTSATSLLYEHYIKKGLLKDQGALKEFVELVRQYDTWEWFENENENAKRLNDLFFLLPPGEFEKNMLERLKTEEHFHFSETEETILQLEEDSRKAYIKKKQRQMAETWDTVYKTGGEPYRIGIVHAESHHSELGNELNRENPHLDLIVILNIGGKRAGFRTIYDHVDVSKYAAQFGGGGHPKASGCTLTPEGFQRFVLPAFEIPPRRRDAHDNEWNVRENVYGTLFINYNREITNLFQTSDKQWKLIHNSLPVPKSFEEFQSAENYLKRQYNSWLMPDEKYIDYISSSLGISQDKVTSDYKEIMDKHRSFFIKES
ncbi:oligoribonuclease [Fictibacillus sp. WQ 8-8]|uniref:DHH family phosphoesterase n=1 Tax=unclassified Fictibacillus TaxID=2644029 RepID=UPI0021088594|nr:MULTISPECIES: oligoribonuclease [unclassified Fictibacillus]MCQ6265297.1 oligoribonuclease [Fictibacillus sp. WQ 8-8]MED2971967.1 oligoribonuclease [Fictibacillus sp. B-59209]